jgi:solute carrier family 35 (adenosine 3'-phospho 5'-phosphosulfate transporter), member B3
MIRDEIVQPLSPSLDSDINLDDSQMEAHRAITRKRYRLVAIVIGMFAAYVAHDYMQELVFSYSSFKFGWFMSLVEVTLISFASFIHLRRSQRDAALPASVVPSLIEAKCAVALAVFITVTQGTGSAAIAYVSYPVKVVMKSAKLLPTMLIRRIFTGAKYSFAQVAAAIGTCASCAAFALADINAANSSRPVSVMGIALLSIAVCADACTANTQEAILTRYRISTSRMVLFNSHKQHF